MLNSSRGRGRFPGPPRLIEPTPSGGGACTLWLVALVDAENADVGVISGVGSAAARSPRARRYEYRETSAVATSGGGPVFQFGTGADLGSCCLWVNARHSGAARVMVVLKHLKPHHSARPRENKQPHDKAVNLSVLSVTDRSRRKRCSRSARCRTRPSGQDALDFCFAA